MTDPEARLARKWDGQSSILAYAGHVLMESRSSLVAQVCLTHAGGTAERDAALVLVLVLVDRLTRRRRITLAADKGHDVMGFVQALRQRRVTPHIAADRRVSKLASCGVRAWTAGRRRHPGYPSCCVQTRDATRHHRPTTPPRPVHPACPRPLHYPRQSSTNQPNETSSAACL